MKKRLRGLLLCGLMCLFSAALSGCGLFKPIEELYQLPALPEEYSQLQTSIQTVMNDLGAEYANISYGSYTSTIQLLDLDSNGSQESAAVFLRVTSAEEKPLRVCFFQRNEDDTYSLVNTLQGDGLTIHSVAYEDLTGDGVRDVIVSWQISTRVYNLSAYQLSLGGAVELMSTSYNERYLTADLDEDGCKELVVFQHRTSEDESNRAELYRYQANMMLMTSSTPLSAALKSVTTARAGRLADGVNGIYVTGEIEGGMLTDILTLEDSVLRNVTLNPEMGMSQTTVRYYSDVNVTDINRDGVLEIPLPVQAAAVDETAAGSQYIIYWRQFDSKGGSTVVNASYHSVTDGWYLILPNDWLGKITVARDDSRSVRGERAVVFYYWPDMETTQPAPFLTVYRLTGDNRYTRARLSGRITLLTETSTIYCASLNGDVWNCGVGMTDLMNQFSLIKAEWSTQ